MVLKVVDIDPQGSINSQGVEWRSLNGQGVSEKLLGSTGDMKPPIQNYCSSGKECKRPFSTNQSELRGLIKSQLQ